MQLGLINFSLPKDHPKKQASKVLHNLSWGKSCLFWLMNHSQLSVRNKHNFNVKIIGGVRGIYGFKE